MASKKHMENSIAERRLRPIYDWLDSGNNKRALHESEKVLKKQPHLQCARVLKSLALLRLGKETESEEILESVRKETPQDESTLQAMTICYREINKPEVICDIYAVASQVEPNSEELLTHLFMAYVRVGNYKKQQLTAMDLYKLKPKNLYYFWAILSIVMQANRAEPHLAKAVVLPLAEKMVERFIKEGKIEEEQELLLYLNILEMQDKLNEALTFMFGPTNEKLQSLLIPTKRVELLVKVNKWRDANITVKKLLCDDMDNWILYLNYLDIVFHLKNCVEKDLSENNEDSDTTIEACVDFLNKLRTKNYKLLNQLRGPYLAELELYLKLSVVGEKPENYVGSLSDLLVNYFKQFGEKQCCLDDLRPYLNLLNQNEAKEFVEHIQKLAKLETGQLSTSKEQMLKYISCLHITRYLGLHKDLTSEAKLELTSRLMQHYLHAAKALDTDILQNNQLLVLIAHVLNDIWLETHSIEYLKEALLVLEFALGKNPSNHQLKLLIIKFYNALGLSKSAHTVFEMLDVKYMQLDSLGYLQCWPLLKTGQYTLVFQLFDTTLKFFTSSYKDSADQLTLFYKFGSFVKVSEFIGFRERLNNSLHYALVTVEMMLLEIFHTTSVEHTLEVLEPMKIIPSEDKTDWNNLKDNRDLEICWTADPLERRLKQEMVHHTFQHDVDLLRIRTLFLRIITAAMELLGVIHPDQTNDNCKGYIEVLISLVDQLKSITGKLSENPPTRLPKDILGAPPESRLFVIIESSFPELVVDLGAIVINIAGISSNDFTLTQPSSYQCVEKVELKLVEIVKKLEIDVKNWNNESFCSEVFNELTLNVEIVCMSAILCGAIFKHAKVNNNLLKKNKRKKEGETNRNQKVLDDIVKHKIDITKRLVSSVIRATNEIITLLGLVETKLKYADVENTVCLFLKELEIEDNSLKKIPSIVENRITESYSSSVSEIRSVLKAKCEYLTELTF